MKDVGGRGPGSKLMLCVSPGDVFSVQETRLHYINTCTQLDRNVKFSFCCCNCVRLQ